MCAEVVKESVVPDFNLLYVLAAHAVGGTFRSMCARCAVIEAASKLVGESIQ
jgi:hypothetical protein